MTEKEMKEHIIEVLEWYTNNVISYIAMSSDYVVDIETDYRKKQYEAIIWEIDRLKRKEAKMIEERLDCFFDFVFEERRDQICPINELKADNSEVPWCCEEVCLEGNLCMKKWLRGDKK